MTNDPTRDAFESWYSDNGVNPKAIERNGEFYKLMQVAHAWWVWQAATLAAAPQWLPIAVYKNGTWVLSTVKGIVQHIICCRVDGEWHDAEGEALEYFEPEVFMPLPLPPTATLQGKP